MSKNRTRTKDKYRVVYTDSQRIELENEFRKDQYILIPRKQEIARSLQLSERQIKIWFQNRRAKSRKQDKRKGVATPSSSSKSDSTTISVASANGVPIRGSTASSTGSTSSASSTSSAAAAAARGQLAAANHQDQLHAQYHHQLEQQVVHLGGQLIKPEHDSKQLFTPLGAATYMHLPAQYHGDQAAAAVAVNQSAAATDDFSPPPGHTMSYHHQQTHHHNQHNHNHNHNQQQHQQQHHELTPGHMAARLCDQVAQHQQPLQQQQQQHYHVGQAASADSFQSWAQPQLGFNHNHHHLHHQHHQVQQVHSSLRPQAATVHYQPVQDAVVAGPTTAAVTETTGVVVAPSVASQSPQAYHQGQVEHQSQEQDPNTIHSQQVSEEFYKQQESNSKHLSPIPAATAAAAAYMYNSHPAGAQYLAEQPALPSATEFSSPGLHTPPNHSVAPYNHNHNHSHHHSHHNNHNQSHNHQQHHDHMHQQHHHEHTMARLGQPQQQPVYFLS